MNDEWRIWRGFLENPIIFYLPFSIFSHSPFLGAFPKKGIRQDGGATPKMRTCHCERSEAIFSIEIASSLALLAITYLTQRVRPLKHVKVVNNSGCVGMPEKWRRLESLRCSGWKPLPLLGRHIARRSHP